MQQLGARTMPQAPQQVAESLDNGTPRRITLLRDADDNRIAETRSVFLEGLRQAFGMGGCRTATSGWSDSRSWRSSASRLAWALLSSLTNSLGSTPS
jgi:hypothetical protein